MLKSFSLKKLKPSFVPGILWLILSTVLLVIPGSSFPKDDWLGKIWFDKWVHIGMFAALVALWCWGVLRIQNNKGMLRKKFLLTAILALGYGIGMEFVQKYFVVNRSFDTGDIVADAGGCVLGLIFSLGRYIKN
ncbi:MAG: VanZ family protein [Chitinophagaceae bacterium]